MRPIPEPAPDALNPGRLPRATKATPSAAAAAAPSKGMRCGRLRPGIRSRARRVVAQLPAPRLSRIDDRERGDRAPGVGSGRSCRAINGFRRTLRGLVGYATVEAGQPPPFSEMLYGAPQKRQNRTAVGAAWDAGCRRRCPGRGAGSGLAARIPAPPRTGLAQG